MSLGVALACLLGFAVLGWLLLPVIRESGGYEPPRASERSELEDLYIQREAIYATLKELDFDHETAKILDADSVFLGTFKQHGKLILYHGMSDQGLSPLDTADWYERVRAANGSDVRDWARLFLVPGMTHCAGGPSTDRFDMLTAIQSWVEEGRAPDRIVAHGKTFPNVTRPLCPYPTVARYAGGGANSEVSFICKE